MLNEIMKRVMVFIMLVALSPLIGVAVAMFMVASGVFCLFTGEVTFSVKKTVPTEGWSDVLVSGEELQAAIKAYGAPVEAGALEQAIGAAKQERLKKAN